MADTTDETDMAFPPYCLHCEAMLTADDYQYAAPLCEACMRRMCAEAGAEAAPAIEFMYLEAHYIKWGPFQAEHGWVWVHPIEVVDWCLGDDPLTAYL